MIISHEHKYIFIKTNKTAGTSIEIALSKFCGRRDVITPIVPEDEEVRKKLGYRGPQNYWATLSDYSPRELARWVLRSVRKRRYYNHISAREIRPHLGAQVWSSYYKFCFERNPWDRVISYYYWRCKTEPRPTISEFIDSDVALKLKRRGYDLYTIDGRVVVDKICRFEKLTEEMETVRVQIGVPEPLDLPRTKTKYRQDQRSYREILGEEDRAKIAALFKEEIELLGYEF
jgi:sulfotransferase famil protein